MATDREIVGTVSDFTDYIADALTSHIASEEDIPDFIMRQGGQIIYADVEEQRFYLITVQEAAVGLPGRSTPSLSPTASAGKEGAT